MSSFGLRLVLFFLIYQIQIKLVWKSVRNFLLIVKVRGSFYFVAVKGIAKEAKILVSFNR